MLFYHTGIPEDNIILQVNETKTFINNRAQNVGPNQPTLFYDADGRFVKEVDFYGTSLNEIKYDAGGNGRITIVNSGNALVRKTSKTDGNGFAAKVEMYNWVQPYDEEGNELPPIENTTERNYLTSTVMGGAVLGLIYSDGVIGEIGVFANGARIGRYYPNTGSYSKFIWEHTDPLRLSGYESSFDTKQFWAGAPNDDLTLPGKVEYEPNGLEVGRLPNMSDLESSNSGGSNWSPGEVGGGWDSMDCTWDGVSVPCGWVREYQSSGGGAVIAAPSEQVASIWSYSQRKFVGLAVWNPAAAEAGLAFLGRESLGWLPTSVSYTPGSHLTGENVYQWFGGWHGGPGSFTDSSDAPPNEISETSAQMYSMFVQGMALDFANFGNGFLAQTTNSVNSSNQPVSAEKAKRILDGVAERARRLLEKNEKCRKAISSSKFDALKMLEELLVERLVGGEFRNGFVPLPDKVSGNYVAYTWSAVDGVTRGTVEFYRDYFGSYVTEVGQTNTQQLGMSDDERRLLTFLHELGHLTRKYIHAQDYTSAVPGFDSSISGAEVNKLIYDNCFVTRQGASAGAK